MTNTLTDRYVTATAQRVPEKQRADLERELRAAIADDIDARVGDGTAPDDAEYAAIAELGDPDRLASDFVGRPVWLIGPALYFGYLRSLRATCWSVLPIVFVTLVVVYRAHGSNLMASIFGALGTTITVGAYLIALMTVIFAVVERAVTKRPNTTTDWKGWKPEQLPIVAEPNPASWTNALSGAVVAVLLIAALLVQRVLSPVTDAAGRAVPIISPELWGFWIPYFMALILIGVVLAFVNAIRHRRDMVADIVRIVLSLAGTVPLAWLFWQAKVINHTLERNTTVLMTPASWISLLATLLLAAYLAAQISYAVRQHRSGATA